MYFKKKKPCFGFGRCGLGGTGKNGGGGAFHGRPRSPWFLLAWKAPPLLFLFGHVSGGKQIFAGPPRKKVKLGLGGTPGPGEGREGPKNRGTFLFGALFWRVFQAGSLWGGQKQQKKIKKPNPRPGQRGQWVCFLKPPSRPPLGGGRVWGGGGGNPQRALPTPFFQRGKKKPMGTQTLRGGDLLK